LGERTVEGSWTQHIEGVLEELRKRIRVEAAIVFGSWARSGGGEWSDIDLLIISSDASNINILDRFTISAEFRRKNIDIFIYTYTELNNMVDKGNPIALSALIEGIPIISNKEIEKLKEKASKMYKRTGRAWTATSPNYRNKINSA